MHPKYLLTGNTPDELALAAVAFLESLGSFTIGLAHRWETPAEFCARIGISPRTFTRRMGSRFVPVVMMERTASGRITQLRASPEFESFMRRKR